MRPVNAAIVLFFGVALIGNVVLYRLQNPPEAEVRSFKGEVEIEVVPDRATLHFERREPLQSTLRVANAAVAGTLAKFRLDPGARVLPIETTLDVQNNEKFVARAASVTGVVLVRVSDMADVATQMQRALSFGINVIGETKWDVSPSRLLDAVTKGQSDAVAKATAEAEDFARKTVRKLTECHPPPGDPVVSGGAGGSGYGGLGGGVERPDVVPIKDLIRPIASMTVPEPDYQGEAHFAPLVTPRVLKVQVVRNLICTFG